MSFNWLSLWDMKTWIWLVWKAIIHNPSPIMCEKASLTPFSLSNHMEDIVQNKFHERLNLELKGHEVSNHMVMIQLHQFCWILIYFWTYLCEFGNHVSDSSYVSAGHRYPWLYTYLCKSWMLFLVQYKLQHFSGLQLLQKNWSENPSRSPCGRGSSAAGQKWVRCILHITATHD